jgi:exopolysaccharide production protein ExoQ
MNGVNQRESGDALAGQPTFLEKGFITIALLYSTGAFSTLLKGTSDLPLGAPTGSLITNTIWTVIYIVTSYLVYSRCVNVRLASRKSFLFISLLVVTAGSVFWSQAVQLTTMRGVALIGSVIVGMYFGLRFPLSQQLKLLALMFGIASSLSIIFSLFLPSYGIGVGVYEGFWQGIYSQKNILGNNMAMAFTVFMVLGASRSAYRWINFLFAGVALVLVILADSVTAIFVCMTILCAFLLFRFFRQKIHRRRRYFLGFSVIVAGAVAYCVSNFSEVLSLAGRDENMTGRFQIWSLVWTAIASHPLLGYGYGAFWRGIDGPSADVWDALGSQIIFHAHNGFLDIWVDIGLLGLGVFLAGYVSYFRRAWLLFINTMEPELIWPVLFMTFLLLSDLTEATFLRVNTAWILYAAIVFSLGIWSVRQNEPEAATQIVKVIPPRVLRHGAPT